MLLARREISKWTALFDLITQFPETIESRFIHFRFNSESPALASVETDESEVNDDSVALEEALVNEDGTKRKKRKRITTRARKVIPGLSFLIIHFLLEY